MRAPYKDIEAGFKFQIASETSSQLAVDRGNLAVDLSEPLRGVSLEERRSASLRTVLRGCLVFDQPELGDVKFLHVVECLASDRFRRQFKPLQLPRPNRFEVVDEGIGRNALSGVVGASKGLLSARRADPGERVQIGQGLVQKPRGVSPADDRMTVLSKLVMRDFQF